MGVSTTIQLAKVRITLEGLPPGLLFGGKGLMQHQANGDTKDTKHMAPEDEAPYRAHWMDKSGREALWSPKRVKELKLCIPAVMLLRSICQGAVDFKDPLNKKKSFAYRVGSTVAFEEDCLPLQADGYDVSAQWVKIPPRTGAMVQIGRPLVRVWKAVGTLLVDDEQYRVGTLEEIIRHAGKNVGIGADRPGLRGPHGKYVLTAFELQPQK